MRNLIGTVLLGMLLLPLGLMGQRHYYVSAAGNDANSGTHPDSAWKTITKVNSTLGSNYLPGDTVSFRAGDTFLGGINVNVGGNPTGDVIFNAYGAGARPVITGGSAVTAWTQVAGRDTFVASVPDPVRNFYVDGQEQELARYPNAHQYLRLDSAKTDYLHDLSIMALPSVLTDSASVCVHTAQWCWEKSAVDSVKADTLFYHDPMVLEALRNYGYFLYGDYQLLDTAGEWHFNGTLDRLYYVAASGMSPSNANCVVVTKDFGMQLASDVCFVRVQGLAFDYFGSHGIYIPNASCKFNSVTNCTFSRIYKHGIQDRGEYNEFSYNEFRQIDGIAMYVDPLGLGGAGGNAVIHHNTFRNNGQFRNSGIGEEVNLSAIFLAFADSCNIHHNDIDSVGYCGISADGKYNLIERNVVRNAMLLVNDGAPFKSFGPGSAYNTWRNNIAYARPGNREGTAQADFRTPGIYFDFSVNNCLVENNTITGDAERGIFQNAGNHHNQLVGNVVYGAERSLELNGTHAINDTLNAMTITHNTFFARDPNAVIVHQVDWTEQYQTGVIDSNHYFQPYDAGRYAFRKVNGVDQYYSFPNWQTTSGFDAHSADSYVSWTLPTDNSRIFINETDTVATVDLLDSLYLDLDSVEVCGSFELQPYSSRVLINTLTACTPSATPEPEGANGLVTLFPNPSSRRVTLRVSPEWLGAQYRLIDLIGHEVVVGKVSSIEQELDLSEVSRGVYLMDLQGRNRLVLRLVRSRALGIHECQYLCGKGRFLSPASQ
ncbi:MAG: right-handed parallel beta-helix repeat-containing protein [Bacteroidia bacterium]